MKPGDLVRINSTIATQHVGLSKVRGEWSAAAATWFGDQEIALMIAVVDGWGMILTSKTCTYGWAPLADFEVLPDIMFKVKKSR